MHKLLKYLIILPVLLYFFMESSCDKKSDETEPVIEDTTSYYPQYGTPLESLPATEDLVVYEVNLRAFSTTGDIQGVIAKLDHIQSLGVNVIWLMPIHPIGQVNSVNSPYSVKDYKAVSSEYGSLEDLRELTTKAHERGMTVMLDWVANHTSWDNSWISNKSWYTQDGSGNIIHPAGTNWQDVADLNFSNTDMRKAMIDAMEYWVMQANVDGFRCDYADGVPKDFWTEAITHLRSLPNRQVVMLAEGSRSDHFTAGFDMSYAWNFYDKLRQIYTGTSATELFATHTSEYRYVPEGKHRMRYTTNHDQSAWENTPMVFFNGKAGALAASVTAIFMEGVPLIYTGQEVGQLNTVPFFTNSPINWSQNPDMLAEYQSLMNIYTTENAARKGITTDFSTSDVVCFGKTKDTEQLLVMVNIRNSTKEFSVPAELQQKSWKNLLTQGSVTLNSTQSLEAYDYLILKVD